MFSSCPGSDFDTLLGKRSGLCGRSHSLGRVFERSEEDFAFIFRSFLGPISLGCGHYATVIVRFFVGDTAGNGAFNVYLSVA